MTKRKLILLLFCILLFTIGHAQVSKTVHVNTPGTLSNLLTQTELNTITDLTLTGNIDARDFKTMRDLMPKVSNFNLESSIIMAYFGTEGTNGSSETNYSANEIPPYAFNNAFDPITSLSKENLISIKMPSSTISIGTYAFYNRYSMRGQLIIPETVTSIGDFAFYNCNRLSGNLTLPNNINFIGKNAFYNCYGFNGTLTLSNALITISERAFFNCYNFIGSLTIPNAVKVIGISAFSKCYGFNGNLTIPNSVKSIGDYAFYECSGFNGTLSLPDSIISIGDYVFTKCSGFNGTLSLPNSIISIGTSAFSGCSSFTGPLNIPNSVTIIKSGAFGGCKGFNGSLSISNSLTIIQDYTFSGCSGFIGSLIIPENVTLIEDNAFSGCSGFTGSLIIPENMTLIENNAFRGCSGFSGSLIIPSKVTQIGSWAFVNCTGFNGTLTLPDGLRGIGSSAFEGCTGFTGSLTIPALVYMLDRAFYNCSGFNGSLTILSKERIPEKAFYGCSGFTGSLHISTRSSIGNSAFYGCKGFNGTLTFEPLIMELGDYAFYGCSGFRGSLHIPEIAGHGAISNYAFYGCSGFDGNLIISNSITYIANYAFFGCSGFKGSLIIPKNVNKFHNNSHESFTIGNFAFAGCSGFDGQLSIPDEKRVVIGKNAFSDCSGFTSLFLPYGVNTIGDNAFINCRSLGGNLILPSSVTTIGVNCFKNCTGFNNELSIPASVTSIDSNAFMHCNFTQINTYNNTPSKIVLGEGVFFGINKTTCKLNVPKTKSAFYSEAPQWKEFLNINEGVPVTLTTGILSSIYSTNPTGTGQITNLDTNDPTLYGVLWSTNPNPIKDISSQLEKGLINATGSFNYNLTNLNSNTKYYVKAYATNSTGTSYGEEISFTTPTPVLTAPSVDVLTGFKTTKGYASTIQTFKIGGTELAGDITVTAPVGFEVKEFQYFINNNFASTIKLTNYSGLITDRTIEVRLSANSISTGIISGEIICTTAWSPKQKVTVTGEVTLKQLTNRTPPTVITNKMVDGNTNVVITKLGTLQGVDASDIGNVGIAATATYNNAAVGINKTITVVYTLTGSAKDKYLAPKNDTIYNAKISDFVTFNPIAKPDAVCEGDLLDLNYSIKTGTPTHYKITFDNAAKNAGLRDLAYQTLSSSANNGTLRISIPYIIADGTYSGTLKMKNELNSESPDYPFEFTVNVSPDNILTKFDEVILFNNISNRFTAFQWLKNGTEILGATKQFYVDPEGLKGSYSVKLTTTDGKTVYTCPKMLSLFTVNTQIRATPNPVKVNEVCKIELSGFTDEQLKKATVAVYSTQGTCIFKSNVVDSMTELQLPAHGVYIGKVTGAGNDYVFIILVTK